MELQVNKFKKANQQLKSTYGCWLGLTNTLSAEICAGAGYDWLLIDAEHAPNDVVTILSQLQAIAPYQSEAVVRPADGNPSTIKTLLDAGATSLLIPMVETAHQAEQLVQAVQYPPNGVRGVGTALSRAASWGRIPNYLDKADDEICLVIQIETAKALENLDEILEVKGIDGIFVGPADMAASIGYRGQPSHPEVVEVIEHCLRKIRKRGKAAGTMATNSELINRYQDAGANFIAVAVDTLLLVGASSGALARAKSIEDVSPKNNGAY